MSLCCARLWGGDGLPCEQAEGAAFALCRRPSHRTRHLQATGRERSGRQASSAATAVRIIRQNGMQTGQSRMSASRPDSSGITVSDWLREPGAGRGPS
jgi:hypothetical protein